jgi:hypothetical protein
MAKAKRITDIAITVDSYEQDGQKKSRRINIGSIWQKDDGGQYMTLETLALNPTLALLNAKTTRNAGNNVIVSMFDVDREPGQSSGTAPKDDDDVPY